MGWLLLSDVHDARLCDAWFSCTDYPIVDVAGNGATLGLVTSGCDCITHLLSQLC